MGLWGQSEPTFSGKMPRWVFLRETVGGDARLLLLWSALYGHLSTEAWGQCSLLVEDVQGKAVDALALQRVLKEGKGDMVFHACPECSQGRCL